MMAVVIVGGLSTNSKFSSKSLAVPLQPLALRVKTKTTQKSRVPTEIHKPEGKGVGCEVVFVFCFPSSLAESRGKPLTGGISWM